MTAHREGPVAPAPSVGQRLESVLQGLLPRGSRTFALLITLASLVGVLIWQLTDYVPLTAMVVPSWWPTWCSDRASCRGSSC